MVLRFQFYAITLHKEKEKCAEKETFHRFLTPHLFLAKQQEKAPPQCDSAGSPKHSLSPD